MNCTFYRKRHVRSLLKCPFTFSLFIQQFTICQKKEKLNLKDKDDGKLDLSDWIIEATRFDQFNSSNLASCIGTGDRYLIARKIGLRMGMDVAFGSDDWGYLINFGSNWLR